jgi:nicotinamide mononucleotide transporter
MGNLKNLKASFKDMKWYEWLMAAIMVIIAGRSMVLAFTNPTAGGNPAWLTIFNFVSAVCGVVCIFFCAKASISNFAFGIVNTIVYAIYLLYWRIYGTFCLEILFYLPMNIISWNRWAKYRDQKLPEKTLAKKLTPVQNGMIVGLVAIVTLITHMILVYVGGTVAWLDALTVSIGLVATVLEMKRYREQYVWWLVTDVVAVIMYIVHFDAVYLTKKSIYLIMAFIGLYNWNKLQKSNNPENN